MKDLLLAFRALWARPAFTTLAVVTLALGIGANSAVFTVIHAVMLAPLPYADPHRVVVLNERHPDFPTPISVSWQNYEDWRDRSRTFEQVAAFRTSQMALTGGIEPERIAVRHATATLLPMLGVSLEAGRHFTAEDERPESPDTAIISHGLWTRRFNAAADAVGAPLLLDTRAYTVVGVLPASFELFQHADVYVPMGPWAATLPDDRGWHPGIVPVARLAAGVTPDEARADMDVVAGQLELEYPQFNRGVRAVVTPMHDVLVQSVRPALLMLAGAVGVVLLIACANVASLLLARAVDRRKEIAVRTALGARRGRIVRQLATESLVLGCAGGLAGLLLASWGVSLVSGLTTALPRAAGIEVNGTVLFFTLMLSMVTGLVFGLAPAWHASRVDVLAALNEEGRAAGSGGAGHRRARAALVVAEVALALVLLIGAGLLLRSFAALQRIDPGFSASNLLVVDVPLSPVTYGDPTVRARAVERIVERARALPGALDAAVTTGLPMAGGGAAIHFNIAGRPPRGPEDYRLAGYRAVTPGYFETMGIPLRDGRTFTPRDREGAPLVAVINESLARQHFRDVDPIGQRVAVGTVSDADTPFIEIVGVVGDVRQSFEAGASGEYYLPYGQHPYPVLAPLYRSASLVVRTAVAPETLAPAVGSAIREIDPDQPLVNVRTMEQALAATVAQPRLRTVLLAIFAGVAVLLAVVGVYGVMAYTVSQRTPEIGVRVALGASERDVVWMVVRQGARLTALGILLGLGGAVVATRALETMLFDLRARDPLTFAGAATLLTAAALVACYLPARRAASVAPAIAIAR